MGSKQVRGAFAHTNGGNYSTVIEACADLKLDFEGRKVALDYPSEDGKRTIKMPDKVSISRMPEDIYLGTVGNNYNFVRYDVGFGVISPLIDKYEGFSIVGGACVNNGERAFLIVDTGEYLNLGKGDIIRNRIIVASSHNGTGKLEVRFTPYREKNKTALTTDANHPLSFKHTKNIGKRLAQASKTFARIQSNWDEFSDGVKRMQSVKLTDPEARSFIEQVLPDPKKKEAGTRLINIRDNVYDLYKTTGVGTRMPHCRDTLFGAVQAFAEYADGFMLVRATTKQTSAAATITSRLLNGTAAKDKARAWATAKAMQKLADKGTFGSILNK